MGRPLSLAELGHDGASAFDVEYLDASGRSLREPLATCWDLPFERATPVRSFPTYKGQVNYPGSWWSSTLRDAIGHESWLERDHFMLLDFDPMVVGYACQPFWLFWNDGRRERRHAPDFFARLADGSGRVIDVRPDGRIGTEDAEAFEATRLACVTVGWTFERVGELDAVYRANVRWLAGYRYRRCLNARHAEGLLSVFSCPEQLMAGALRVGDPIAVLPTLYHLLWSRRLVTDLHSSPMGADSVVRCEGGTVT